MAKGIIQHIVQDLKEYSSQVLLVENTDKFLSREEVLSTLLTYGIRVVQGTKIHQRVEFELREDDEVLLLLSQDNTDYLEDITKTATAIDFDLKTYFGGYHIPSIRKIEISILDILFSQKQIISLNRIETLQLIDRIRQERMPAPEVSFDIPAFIDTLDKRLEVEPINWSEVCKMISKAVLKSIRTSQVETLITSLGETNTAFQENIKTSYQATKNSNAIKGPKIVSKILEYLSSNFLEKKVALVVVDGLAFWQYEVLKNKLPNAKSEDVIYSWLPSITQLSRQAIFRGETPQKEYRQGPANEERLWKNYWKTKGINEFQIRYNHEKIDLLNLQSITKFAIVFKDLDEKMHSSSDYKDLLDLTENWIERNDIYNVVKTLKEEGFSVFLTTDHGNIQAKGWRGLQGREKLGTQQSGSRSKRHLEYTEEWLFEDFIANNPELKDSLSTENQSIYIKDNLSFSSEDTLVTHGGAHLLEVLIPFIEI
ncbi:PglZ domain-containing protein [Aequorivita marina]|uniref:PglZ domain-containing protein n=1 Tax=Aequorivita marina TaxID=3073654 RepID=UPI002876C50C|nr:PglZ domain-containing protein [Aequorivita sp. S2608]MDS1299183.1 PglZ domain-containing protein [Aequorivita sp. S2608]